MTIQHYKATERGKANFGWLDANFSFSFGNYFDKDKVQFGVLRVLNDDTIAAGMGFGTHPHENMEIITIPLEGGLKHSDSMGNEGVIGFGEVQVMSAGTGILHSEMNASPTERAKTLQLWVFPERQNVTPRYDQKSFDLASRINTFVTVVSPHDSNEGTALWVYQQTYFSLGIFEKDASVNYTIKIPGNGVYLFVIEGQVLIGGKTLQTKDALGIIDTDHFDMVIQEHAKILLVEVPMINE